MADMQYFVPIIVEIIPALSEQAPVLANLLELYTHDMSEFSELELGEDGRFGYKYLSLYWEDASRHPFFIRVSGNLAGFALVRKGSQITGDEQTWDMAEFFIVRAHRGVGAGIGAVHAIWRMFPGKWEVRVMERNRGAREFWARAITAFAGKASEPVALEKNGSLWRVFSFTSG